MIHENKKSPAVKNMVMLVMSLAVGGIGVFFANRYIDGKVDFYRSQMDKKETLVSVVVPKRNMKRGELVLGGALAVREFPGKYMDSNAVTPNNYKIAIGQKLDFDIDEGKPLLWAHLDGGLSPTFSGKLEDGYRALTISVDTINSISGFLQPKDKVDLMLTYSGDEVDEKITFPFIQNLLVLATGVKTVVDKTGRAAQKSYNTITVKVTPIEAKKIILAQEVGKMTATLRNPDDAVAISSRAVKVRDILEDKARKRVYKKRPVLKTGNGIEFIIGGS